MEEIREYCVTDRIRVFVGNSYAKTSSMASTRFLDNRSVAVGGCFHRSGCPRLPDICHCFDFTHMLLICGNKKMGLELFSEMGLQIC